MNILHMESILYEIDRCKKVNRKVEQFQNNLTAVTYCHKISKITYIRRIIAV